jgi:circadian clock protein KaiB
MNDFTPRHSLPNDYYVFRLIVTGQTPLAKRAIDNITAICDNELKGRCELEIIDLLEEPDAAGRYEVAVTPLLIKEWPEPERRFFGDLSDPERLRRELGLRT